MSGHSSAAMLHTPERSFIGVLPASAPRRTFRIALGDMNVTVHPGQDLSGVRIIEGVTPRYFIDDREVDEATFDREMKRNVERV